MTLLNTVELAKQTGAGRYDFSILEEIIDQAEGEITGILLLNNLTLPTSSAVLKRASALLSRAGLYDRMRMDGSIPGDSGAKYYNLGEITRNYREEAQKLIQAYISSVQTVCPSSTSGAVRSDYVFKEMKLHQGDISTSVDINDESLSDTQKGE